MYEIDCLQRSQVRKSILERGQIEKVATISNNFTNNLELLCPETQVWANNPDSPDFYFPCGCFLALLLVHTIYGVCVPSHRRPTKWKAGLASKIQGKRKLWQEWNDLKCHFIILKGVHYFTNNLFAARVHRMMKHVRDWNARHNHEGWDRMRKAMVSASQ